MTVRQMETLGGVLLEFDGIVADTDARRREVVREVCHDEGLAVTDLDYDDVCAGLSAGEGARAIVAIRRPALDDTALDLLALRAERAYAAALAKGIVLVEGVRAAIERIAGDLRVGIVTRLRRADVQSFLDMAALGGAVTLLLGAEDAYPHKPSPAPYRKAIERLRRLPGSEGRGIIALESSLSGIRAARAAGAPCVAVGNLPAHVAIEADALVPMLAGHDARSLAALLGIPFGGPDAA